MGEHVGHASPAGRSGLRRRAPPPRGLRRGGAGDDGDGRGHRHPAPPAARVAGARARLPEPLRRYFSPGINWAGRTVYGIPVFGFALLAMSQRCLRAGAGLGAGRAGLFAGVALVGEGSMWPAERRLQVALSSTDAPPPVAESLDHDAAAMSRAATAALGVAGGGDGAHGGATLTGRTERDPVRGPVLSALLVPPGSGDPACSAAAPAAVRRRLGVPAPRAPVTRHERAYRPVAAATISLALSMSPDRTRSGRGPSSRPHPVHRVAPNARSLEVRLAPHRAVAPESRVRPRTRRPGGSGATRRGRD